MNSALRPSSVVFGLFAALLLWRVVLPASGERSGGCALCEITARAAADSLTPPRVLPPEVAAGLTALPDATPPAPGPGGATATTPPPGR